MYHPLFNHELREQTTFSTQKNEAQKVERKKLYKVEIGEVLCPRHGAPLLTEASCGEVCSETVVTVL